MSRQTFRSNVLALVLVVCAATLWDQTLAWLHQLAGLTVVRGEQGSDIDPSGSHAATHSPQAPTPRGGWTVVWAKHGSGIDPSGTPAAAGSEAAGTPSGQSAVGLR
jgi:hypothetical protein